MKFSTPIAAVMLVCLVILSGCGPDSTDQKTQPTLPASGETVRDLVRRIDQSWSLVTGLRVTSQQSGSDIVTVEEWSAPNNRSVTEMQGQTVTNDMRAIDGRVYMRGAFVSTIAPDAGTSQWITIDPTKTARDTPLGNRVAYLTRPASQPLSSFSDDVLAQETRSSGFAKVGERRCEVFVFGDANGIRYELAIDGQHLPCQLVMRAGTSQDSSVFEINPEDVRITSPDAASPAASPVASPAPSTHRRR